MALFHAFSKRCVQSIVLDLRRRTEEPVEGDMPRKQEVRERRSNYAEKVLNTRWFEVGAEL